MKNNILKFNNKSWINFVKFFFIALVLTSPLFFTIATQTKFTFFILAIIIGLLGLVFQELKHDKLPWLVIIYLFLVAICHFIFNEHIYYYSLSWGVAASFLIAVTINFLFLKLRKKKGLELQEIALFTLAGLIFGFTELGKFLIFLSLIGSLMSLYYKYVLQKDVFPVSIAICVAIYTMLISISI